MPRRASARRYAQAVFQIALEQDRLDQWSDDLDTLCRAVEEEVFLAFLDSPQVTTDRKAEAVQQVLGDAVDPLARNLLSLMASRGIAHLLPQVRDQYRRLVDEHRGVARVHLVTAVPLTEEERRKAVDTLRALAGGEIRLSTEVDPSILGGLVVQVGDRVIDGSVRTRLQEMRKELLEGAA